MTYSMNEIGALAKRAARGAGYPWGIAEEAGFATRWLCSHGQPGCEVLAALLQHNFGREIVLHTPRYDDGRWTSKRQLCPLATGATLLDRARSLDAGITATGIVVEPLMILPFLSQASILTSQAFTITGEAGQAVVDGDSLSVSGSFRKGPSVLHIKVMDTTLEASPIFNVVLPGEDAILTLKEFEQRVFAPSTEQSRSSGAGAGVLDND